mmetsp:Transcript_65/g.179  ORF Transcript_65/g.179 Transcript_65/m.179 type:complete len:147 (-) Transcript_65:305-745(-)
MEVNRLLTDDKQGIQEQKTENEGGRSESNTEKEHFCPQCLTVFASKANLKVHIRTVHHGLQPYQCPDCERTFGTRSSMRRHHRIVHKQLRPHKCAECSRIFSTKSCLKRHCLTIHKVSKDNVDAMMIEQRDSTPESGSHTSAEKHS